MGLEALEGVKNEKIRNPKPAAGKKKNEQPEFMAAAHSARIATQNREKLVLGSTPKKSAKVADAGLGEELDIIRGQAPEQDKLNALSQISQIFVQQTLAQGDTDSALQTIKDYVLDAPAGSQLKMQAMSAIASIFYSQAPKSSDNVNLMLPCLEGFAGPSEQRTEDFRSYAIGAVSAICCSGVQTTKEQSDAVLVLMDSIASNRDLGSNLRQSALNATYDVFLYAYQHFPDTSALGYELGLVLPGLLSIARESDEYVRAAAFEAIGAAFQTGSATAQDVAGMLPLAKSVAEDAALGEWVRRSAINAIGSVFAVSYSQSTPPYSLADASDVLPVLASAMSDASLGEDMRNQAVLAIQNIFRNVPDPDATEDRASIISSLAQLAANTDLGKNLRMGAMWAVTYCFEGAGSPDNGVDMGKLVGIFLNMAKDTGLDSELRWTAIETLIQTYKWCSEDDANASLSLMADLAKDNDTDVRNTATYALSRMCTSPRQTEKPEALVDKILSVAVALAMDDTSWSTGIDIIDYVLPDKYAHKSSKTSSILLPLVDWVDSAVHRNIYEDTPENRASNDYAKTQALFQLNIMLYYADDALFGRIAGKADQLRNDATLDEKYRIRAGGALANACFIKPELFSKYGFFNLDKETADAMTSASPMWVTKSSDGTVNTTYTDSPTTSFWLGADDFSRIYELSMNNPDKPVVKTLFEDANLTCLGYYPTNILQHMYDDRNRLTGKQVFYVINTKHNWNGYPFGSYLTPDMLGKFDVRIIEPDTDGKIAAYTDKTAARLGITSKYDDPAGPKINFLVTAGHGWPGGIEIKIVPGGGDVALYMAKLGIAPKSAEISKLGSLKTGESVPLDGGKAVVRRAASGMLEIYSQKTTANSSLKGKLGKTRSITDGGDHELNLTDVSLKAVEPYISGGRVFSLATGNVGDAGGEFAKYFKVPSGQIKGSELEALGNLKKEGDAANMTVNGKVFNAFVSQGRVNVCEQAEGFDESCSNAGDNGTNINIAEFIAKGLNMKIWGAQVPAGMGTVTYAQNQSGQWHIADVNMQGAPTTSYDYCNTALLLPRSSSIAKDKQNNVVNFEVAKRSGTDYYAVERSVDGGNFEEVSRFAPNASGNYQFAEPSPSGKALYRVKEANLQIVGTDGSKAYAYGFTAPMEVGSATSVGNEQSPANFDFALMQNFPNPFNAKTTIRYSIPKSGKVGIKVYDILGREVKTLVDRRVEAGAHITSFDASNLASGVYVYEIMTEDGKRMAKKMMIVK